MEETVTEYLVALKRGSAMLGIRKESENKMASIIMPYTELN